MIYAGIGSRKVDNDFTDALIVLYGSLFGKLGFTLRSGGADGCDSLFEKGCDIQNGKKEIYLPWKGFNNHPSPLYEIPQLAFEIGADVYGPSWSHLKDTSKKFLARDIQQVLGEQLDTPCDFVVCWTPDGCTTKAARTRQTGGTGQAIACADERGIPVFNLQTRYGSDELLEFLEVERDG